MERPVLRIRPAPLALTVTLACALLGACQRKPPPAPAESVPAPAPATTTPAAVPTVPEDTPPEGVLRAYVWDCAGTKIRARNLWRENAIAVDLHDGTHKLLNVPSASGAKYTDGSVTLFTKGGAATLETPWEKPRQCGEVRAESLLEDARLRGVRYSGRGNEPGWTLEIGPGDRLAWVTGYGEERHELATPTVTVDAAGTQTYSGADAAGPLVIAVTKTACQDDMSGEPFEYRVVVAFGGREYRGCGTQVQP